MNVAIQAAKYSQELAHAKHQLFAVQTFDRSMLRNSRINQLLERIETLELAVRLCNDDDAQIIEDLAESACTF